MAKAPQKSRLPRTGRSPFRPKKGSFHRQHHKKPEKIYDEYEARERLDDIFRNHGFADYEFQNRAALVQFYRLLMHHQEKYNITRLTRFRDVCIKHFIDSLMVTRLTDLVFPLMDVGTGPGFPGVPLKIHFPSEPIYLAEGVLKRVQFLKTVRKELSLKNLEIVGRKIDKSFNTPVSGVITRAFASTPETLNALRGCLKNNGMVYLMKGPNVDKEDTLSGDLAKEFQVEKDLFYEIPNTPHERRLLVFRRTGGET